MQDTQGWRYLTCPLLGGMVEGSVQSYTGGLDTLGIHHNFSYYSCRYRPDVLDWTMVDEKHWARWVVLLGLGVFS